MDMNMALPIYIPISEAGTVDDSLEDGVDDSLEDGVYDYEDDPYYVFVEVGRALERDKSDEFVKLIKNKNCDDLKIVWADLFYYDAVKCAASILAGETEGFMSFSDELSACGTNPLHRSAGSVAPGLTELFLKNGFSADARSDTDYMDLKQPLPLSVVLRLMRCDGRATHKAHRSALKLIMALCDTTMRSYLETVRLLSLKTKEVKQMFYNYLMEGKMVETGALLIVAYKDLFPISVPEGDDVRVFSSIREMRDFLSAKQDTLSNSGDPMCKDKSKRMKEIVLLLDIFDEIGHELAKYVRLERQGADTQLEVASLLAVKGFGVKTRDTYLNWFGERSGSSLFDWKVLHRKSGSKADHSYLQQLRNGSWLTDQDYSQAIRSKFQGNSGPAQRSFHTASLLKVDSELAVRPIVERSVNAVPILKTCNKWPLFFTTLKRGL